MPREDTTTSTEPNSNGFYTTGILATLAGATAGVVIVTNTVTAVFGGYPKWLPLVLALAAAFGAYLHAARRRPASFQKTPVALRYPIVILNGCLIYISAFGLQGVVMSETVSVPEESVAADDSSASSVGSTASAKLGTKSLSPWVSVFSSGTTRELGTRRDSRAPISRR